MAVEAPGASVISGAGVLVGVLELVARKKVGVLLNVARFSAVGSARSRVAVQLGTTLGVNVRGVGLGNAAIDVASDSLSTVERNRAT